MFSLERPYTTFTGTPDTEELEQIKRPLSEAICTVWKEIHTHRLTVPALGSLSMVDQGGPNAHVILFLLAIIYVVPKEPGKIRHLNYIHSLKQFLYHLI